jgi:hypothetical protein
VRSPRSKFDPIIPRPTRRGWFSRAERLAAAGQVNRARKTYRTLWWIALIGSIALVPVALFLVALGVFDLLFWLFLFWIQVYDFRDPPSRWFG